MLYSFRALTFSIAASRSSARASDVPSHHPRFRSRLQDDLGRSAAISVVGGVLSIEAACLTVALRSPANFGHSLSCVSRPLLHAASVSLAHFPASAFFVPSQSGMLQWRTEPSFLPSLPIMTIAAACCSMAAAAHFPGHSIPKKRRRRRLQRSNLWSPPFPPSPTPFTWAVQSIFCST